MKPSVSELLDLLNKPALLYWANKLGLEGVPLQEFYKKSKKSGISIHSQIRCFCEQNVPFEDPEHQAKFLSFIKDKQIVDFEKPIETDHFVGRYDVRILIENQPYICDFKSNSKVYFENLLQLTAYRMAYPECKLAVIEVPSFTFKPIEIEDFKILENILKCLSYIAKHKPQYS